MFSPRPQWLTGRWSSLIQQRVRCEESLIQRAILRNLHAGQWCHHNWTPHQRLLNKLCIGAKSVAAMDSAVFPLTGCWSCADFLVPRRQGSFRRNFRNCGGEQGTGPYTDRDVAENSSAMTGIWRSAHKSRLQFTPDPHRAISATDWLQIYHPSARQLSRHHTDYGCILDYTEPARKPGLSLVFQQRVGDHRRRPGRPSSVHYRLGTCKPIRLPNHRQPGISLAQRYYGRLDIDTRKHHWW